VRLRAQPKNADLDGLVVTEVSVDGARMFKGELGRLRGWTKRSFALSPGQTKQVRVRAWLPVAASGYEFRATEVALQWQAREA
jgi:hypothetical protein